MLRLGNGFPIYIDSRGALVDAGYIRVGVANQDPATHPIDLFVDQDLSIPIEQPLRTSGGLIVNGENPTFIYMDAEDYSLRVSDANDQQVYYIPSQVLAGGAEEYQPLDADLTAIAALTTTTYGRSLLTLANQAALVAALGLPAYLQLIGGTVSGNIVRSGGGAHVYHADAALTSGRIFVTAADAADPTSQPGEIWLKMT